MALRRSKIEDQINDLMEVEDIPGLDVYCLKGSRHEDPEVKGTDAFKLYIDFDGPVGSAYEGGHFHTCWCYPADYFTDPKKGPTITFTHQIYHPSVKKDGSHICADGLHVQDGGAAVKTVDQLRILIQALQTPEKCSPLELDIAQQCKTNPDAFRRTAAEWTKLYAK